MRELAEPMLKNQYGLYLIKVADEFEKDGAVFLTSSKTNDSDEFLSKVIRLSYSVLDKTKIKEELCVEIPYW